MTFTRQLKMGGFFGIFTLLSAGAALAGDTPLLSVKQVQSALSTQRATWEAQDNWVSRLPKDQVQRMLGVRELPDTIGEFSSPTRAIEKSQAESLDWRNKGGVNWVSPILNQGACGSCVAFASVATMETQMNITSGIPGLNTALSPQALFACGGGACEFGWQPALAARYLIKNGVPDEACAPYTMGATGETVACNTVCSDSRSRSTKVIRSTQPTRGEKLIENVKAALKNGPLVTTLMVYEDFITYSKGIYKHTTGTTLGGHAVSIVGFDDTTRSWIIRNSWGKDWGEDGFARVSWDDTSGIGNETWSLEVAPATGYVTIKNPTNRDFVSGVLSVKAESTLGASSTIQLQVLGGQGQLMAQTSCQSGECALELDTRKLPDGKYETAAVAQSGSVTLAAPRQYFYVLNRPAQLSLSFSGDAGLDLSRPLSDRVVFKVQSSTGTEVPLSKLVFHARNSAGQEIYTKEAQIVLNEMIFGWRTPAVPNGAYEIWFSGELTSSAGTQTVESQRTTVRVKN